MVLLTIRMKVLSVKRLELSQTIASLIGSIRVEKGCKRCDFCQDVKDENELCLLTEWDTQKNLKNYLKSERFKVLRGAMNLLKEPCDMMFLEAKTVNFKEIGSVQKWEGSKIIQILSPARIEDGYRKDKF
jgi:quinol monooxygenase YgiN